MIIRATFIMSLQSMTMAITTEDNNYVNYPLHVTQGGEPVVFTVGRSAMYARWRSWRADSIPTNRVLAFPNPSVVMLTEER
jgi:hypothetical protein